MIESTGSMGRSATYAEEVLFAENERLKQENEKLCKRLSGALQHLEEAREGRAAAIDRLTPLGCENAELRALLTQAPIAKVVVREGCAHYAPDDVSVSLYAPGLPPGEYDLYLMPDVPQPREHDT